jgi:hypothetical protein
MEDANTLITSVGLFGVGIEHPDSQKLNELSGQMATYRVFCSIPAAPGCPAALIALSFQSVARFFLATPCNIRHFIRYFVRGNTRQLNFLFCQLGSDNFYL